MPKVVLPEIDGQKESLMMIFCMKTLKSVILPIIKSIRLGRFIPHQHHHHGAVSQVNMSSNTTK